jgi:hypothetical protein
MVINSRNILFLHKNDLYLKKIVKKLLTISLVTLFLFNLNAFAQQCDTRGKVFECAEIFGDSVTYLNDFEVIQPKRKTKDSPNGMEWDIYLMKGTEYRFALCCKPYSDKILNLYDDKVTEQNPYETTEVSRKGYFDFVCTQSGIYKVSIRFKSEESISKEMYALGILGYVRKVNLADSHH